MQLQYYHGNYSITMTSPAIDAFTTPPATTAPMTSPAFTTPPATTATTAPMTSPAFTTRPVTTASPPTQAPLASAPIIGGVVGAIAVIVVGVILIVLIVVCAKGGSKAGHQR